MQKYKSSDFLVSRSHALRGNAVFFDALRRETDAERQRIAFRRGASEREEKWMHQTLLKYDISTNVLFHSYTLTLFNPFPSFSGIPR